MSANAALSESPERALRLPTLPYPGIRPFREDEWQIFFGREVMVDEVVRRLIRQQLLVVHGDSGSGKSSLIYAGVLPVLEQQSENSAFRWRTCHAVPGNQPLENLADALAALSGDDNTDKRRFDIRQALSYGQDAAAKLAELVRQGPEDHICLLLDQFEELFTHSAAGGPREVRQVIEFLIGLQKSPVEGFHAVLTMRSEFLGACAQYPDFAETVNATQYLLPRLKRPELLRAIQEPARICGGDVTRELADSLIDETAQTSDQLPLIQHGLMKLYREHVLDARVDGEPPKRGWTLSLDLCDGKSLADLLSDHADAVATAAEREVFPERDNPRVVEAVFRAITTINADGHAVRRRQTLAQLAAITGEKHDDLQAVLKSFRAEGVSFLRPFGDAPLAPADLVDISHEALIRSWKRVSAPVEGWLAREFRQGLAWKLMVEQAQEFLQDRTRVLAPAAADDRKKLILEHTRPWSELYGGNWDSVNQLVTKSVAAGKRAAQQRAAFWVVLAIMFVAGVAAFSAQRLEVAKLAEATAVAEAKATDQRRATESEVQLALEKQRIDLENQRTESADNEQQKRLSDIDILVRAAFTKGSASKKELGDILNVIASEETASPTEFPTPVVNRDITPRLYFYISDESQKAAAQAVADKASALSLGGRAVVVPSVAVRATDRSALRCFSAEDCREGSDLFASVQGFVTSPALQIQDQSENVRTGKMPATRPRHYELWFAPGPIGPSAAGSVPARNIAFSQEIVNRIRSQPGAPYPSGARPAVASTERKVVAIVLHDSYGMDDKAVSTLRSGEGGVPGPLTNWAVQSDGSIVIVADEGQTANHAGASIAGISNANTIGIDVIGVPALTNAAQLESLVRLVVDVADRWKIPTSLILSHAETAVPAGRKTDMLQQAPIVRQMVDEVRTTQAP